MHIKDHSAAMKFFRTYDSAASKGKWKDFVDEMEFESMIQKPRAMAQEPRIGLAGGQLVRNTVDGSRPGYKGDTSKVYNEKTGHIYKFTNRFNTVYSKTPPKNQYTDKMRTLEEIQKAIDDAPPKFVKRKDGTLKKVPVTPRDLWGGGKHYPHKIIASTEYDKYKNQLNIEGKGKPVVEDPRKGNIVRYAKNKLQSNTTILAKMAGEEGLHLSHLSLTELDSLKNLGYLPADINIKSYHSFEKKIVANAKEIYAVQNNKSLSLPEKRAEIAKLQKIDRALRKEFPKYANTKARLKVQANNLELSGLKIGEKLPDPTVAISQTEGTLLKDIKAGSKKEKDLLKLSKKSLESKLKVHLKANPKLAIEIQKQLDAGYDMTKILNSPAVKKGMPGWVKGELAFVAIDIMNNWTKGQSFWKGLGKGIETGSLGIIDLNTDERALLSKGKKLVAQGVITQQELDSMESWLEYTEALKNRRATQEDLFSAAEDLKVEGSDKNILEGETAGWNTLEAGVKAGADELSAADKNLDQSIKSYYSITDNDSMGYDTMSKVIDHLVGEEWNKPAGTVIDRGKRLHQGEGIPWSIVGNVIRDVGNVAASPWLGLKDSHILEQTKMNLGLKETTPQERIMQHPVHGFEEAKLKHPEAWEDITDDMKYALEPTEQLWKAEGGIMSLKK